MALGLFCQRNKLIVCLHLEVSELAVGEKAQENYFREELVRFLLQVASERFDTDS